MVAWRPTKEDMFSILASFPLATGPDSYIGIERWLRLMRLRERARQVKFRLGYCMKD